MPRVAVIGEEIRVSGFSLAGAEVHPADDSAAAQRAWAELDTDVAVVVLTPRAAEALANDLATDTETRSPSTADRLTVVMPG